MLHTDCKFKTSVGEDSISVPHKIDIGSNGNIMPLYVFKKLFPGVRNEWLAETINKHILLKTYNKTTITVLGTCKVMIEHKNNRKKCQFSVVPGNGQALLGIPGTDTFQMININIDSIDVEDVENGEWYINTSTAQKSNIKQETSGVVKYCANIHSISKSTNNSKKSTVNTNSNKSTNYFLAGPNCDKDKKKSAELTQQINKEFNDVFHGIGYFEGTFSLQLKLDSRAIPRITKMCSICIMEAFQR